MRKVYEMGDRRELAGEGFLLTPVRGCDFRVGQLFREEVVLTTDAPGECSNCMAYHHLVDLGNGRHRLYYGAGKHRTNTAEEPETTPESIFAAETADGIHFERCKVPGSRLGDNCVLDADTARKLGVYTSTFFAFRDDNPNEPPERRFKMIALAHAVGEHREKLRLFSSPDGFAFEPFGDETLDLEGDFDSLNTCYYDPAIGRYRLFFRSRNFGCRTIRTAVTQDWVFFESQSDLLYDDGQEMALYTNAIAPYFRAPHILVGFPMRYCDNEDVWDERMLSRPHPEFRVLRANFTGWTRLGTACTDSILLLGRDGYHFKRYGEAILRPGPCTEGSWNYGDNDLGRGMIVTKSSRGYGAPDELSVYALENVGQMTGCTRLRRYSLRMDGFASIHFTYACGEAVSRPFAFTGNALSVNLATSAAGGIAFEFQDAATGLAVPGFALDDCCRVAGDTLDAIVHWGHQADVSALAGRALRLRVVGSDADLYSLRFATLDEFPVLPRIREDARQQPIFRYER